MKSEFHTFRYSGKVNQDFLKIDSELSNFNYILWKESCDMLCTWIILEGWKIQKLLLDVEVW